MTTTVGFTERVVSTALASIALEAIDLTDGTWTLDDPTSMVKTTTHAAGVNTITFNAKAATANYLMTSGANFTGARYYKLLSISGSQATTATPLVFVADVEPDVSASSTFNQKHYIGTTHNPTSTVVNTISGVGGGWQITKRVDDDSSRRMDARRDGLQLERDDRAYVHRFATGLRIARRARVYEHPKHGRRQQ